MPTIKINSDNENLTFREKFRKLMKNRRFRIFLNALYSVGASVVILGALFKIQHWNGSGIMLSAGLITEAIIFFIYAFDAADDVAEEEPKVQNFTNFSIDNLEMKEEVPAGLSALMYFDKILADADLNPELFMNLGAGMKKLGEHTEHITTLVDVSGASKDYLKTIKRADESLAKTARSYEKAISEVTVKTVFKYKGISNSLSNIENGSLNFQRQMKNLNENISSLNGIYDKQRKVADEQLKHQMMSAEETRNYHENVKELNQNLVMLNQIYGNMVNAMYLQKK